MATNHGKDGSKSIIWLVRGMICSDIVELSGGRAKIDQLHCKTIKNGGLPTLIKGACLPPSSSSSRIGERRNSSSAVLPLRNQLDRRPPFYILQFSSFLPFLFCFSE